MPALARYVPREVKPGVQFQSDEDLARAVLREHLAAHPDVEIVGECANGFEAVKAATDLKPDLMFLDIQMPKLDGFEVLELLDPRPTVVFVTAFDEHAVRALADDLVLHRHGQFRSRGGHGLNRGLGGLRGVGAAGDRAFQVDSNRFHGRAPETSLSPTSSSRSTWPGPTCSA